MDVGMCYHCEFNTWSAKLFGWNIKYVCLFYNFANHSLNISSRKTCTQLSFIVPIVFADDLVTQGVVTVLTQLSWNIPAHKLGRLKFLSIYRLLDVIRRHDSIGVLPIPRMCIEFITSMTFWHFRDDFTRISFFFYQFHPIVHVI